MFTLTLLMSFVTLAKRSIPETVQESEVADYSNPNIDLLNPLSVSQWPSDSGLSRYEVHRSERIPSLR